MSKYHKNKAEELLTTFIVALLLLVAMIIVKWSITPQEAVQEPLAPTYTITHVHGCNSVTGLLRGTTSTSCNIIVEDVLTGKEFTGKIFKYATLGQEVVNVGKIVKNGEEVNYYEFK